MLDALDEYEVGRIPPPRPSSNGSAIRTRDSSRRRAQIAAGAQITKRIEVATSTQVQRVEQDDDGVTVFDAKGGQHRGIAVIGADGVKSAVRRQYVGDDARVSVTSSIARLSDSLPTCAGTRPASGLAPITTRALPARGGEQYNVVVTFHSNERKSGACALAAAKKCRATRRHLRQGAPAHRPAQGLVALGHRRPRADRAVELRRVTLLGDAARDAQYLAQGACAGGRRHARRGDARDHNDFAKAFDLYQRSRVTRTARIVLSAREMGRIFHARVSSVWCATNCGRAVAGTFL